MMTMATTTTKMMTVTTTTTVKITPSTTKIMMTTATMMTVLLYKVQSFDTRTREMDWRCVSECHLLSRPDSEVVATAHYWLGGLAGDYRLECAFYIDDALIHTLPGVAGRWRQPTNTNEYRYNHLVSPHTWCLMQSYPISLWRIELHNSIR